MKKTLMVLLAVVLIVAISVGGTMAYFTAKSDAVTNVFTAGKLSSDFRLQEHKAIKQTDGSYLLGETLVQGNTYNVVPGVDIPKDPFVSVTVDIDAYLFTEVVGTAGEGWSWSVSSEWTKLEGVKGPHDGQMYYKALSASEDSQTIGILTNNKITVASSFDVSKANDMNLTFYAYLCQQASFEDAAGAWNAVKSDFAVSP